MPRLPKHSLQTKHPTQTKRPLRVAQVLATFLTLTLIGLMARVVQLQTHPSEPIANRMDTQMSTRQLLARRGSLHDRHGDLLASSRIDYKIYLDPSLSSDQQQLAHDVAYALGYSPKAVLKKINQSISPRYVVLDVQARPERVEVAKRLDIPGLGVEPMLVREYPYGALAGQVLGFVSTEGKGLEGSERMFDQALTADQGKLSYIRDASRRALFAQASHFKPQQDGQHLRLSIDSTLQHICETQLEKAVSDFDAVSGQVVLMDPYTGEILAMANIHVKDQDGDFNTRGDRQTIRFSPQNFRQSSPEDWRNRCVTDVFEPGSIFKPFVWAGLTQLGAATPDEVINTEHGAWRTDFRRTLRDAYPYKELDWEFVLVKSSNIGMGKIAQRVSHDDLRKIVANFGFGTSTGSRLPGEQGGLITSPKRWSDFTQTSVPMGQEIAVTPLQLVRATAAIANGGTLITPTLVAFDPTNPQPGLLKRRILRPDIAETTKNAMRKVMTEGTGRKANKLCPHYSIFGKTGTAQLPDKEKGGYHQDRYISSFVAGAPMQDPRLVIGVLLQDPDKNIGHGGGTAAGPVATQIMEEALVYLGVKPDIQPFEKTPAFFVLTGDPDFENPIVTEAKQKLAEAQADANE